MNRHLFFTYAIIMLSICISFLSNAQKVIEIPINTKNTSLLKLSQIAESVSPIYLDRKIDWLQFLHFTDQSIFVCGRTEIYQFTTSGEFVKKVDCKTDIQGITGNSDTKEIYIAARDNTIKCYDYSLNKKKEYKTQHIPNALFYHNKHIWIHSFVELNVGIGYTISKINIITGKETFNNLNAYNLNSAPRSTHGAVSEANFFTYNNELLIAPTMDSTIYKIEGDKILSFFNWRIKPKEGYYYYKPFVLSFKGITGNFIYINYILRNSSDKYINNRRCFYFENLKSGEKYNINNTEEGPIYDDFYHTGYFNIISLSNKPGYFYFIKEAAKIKQKANKINTNNKIVIFIVKTKE